MIETYRGVVYPHQIDHMHHMNVQWYASKFDEATWHLFSAVGLTSHYIAETGNGMAALEQHTKYTAEVMVGQLLVVRTRVLEVRAKTIRFIHTMFDAENNTQVATSELLGVHIDLELRKSVPLPAEVVRCSEELIGSD
jgi:acyl-CoA thioester hydrolase